MSTLLRMATAGSVDDGKSTLVGRLLYDSKSVLADQLEAVERVSHERGMTQADLALLTDGLRAEREQGITIDVAYRYFATANRTFILADCPGHVQYTRNTVTGASTADVVVLLTDARKGLLEQTRRHLAVAALLRVPHIVVAVNKMDLVDFSRERFAEIERDVLAFAESLHVMDVTSIPVSALLGDNIVDQSQQMDWYDGPPLLEILEQMPGAADLVNEPFRMPVQTVIRPQQAAVDPKYLDYRGYAGQVATGSIVVGDRVAVLPSGLSSTVAGIDIAPRPGQSETTLHRAEALQSITLRLDDDIDISRGDVLCSPKDRPDLTQDIDGTVCWLSDRPLRPGGRVLVKHGTRTVQAMVRDVLGSLDLDSMSVNDAESLQLNDIGYVRLRLAQAIPAELYLQHRLTGAFLVVDSHDGYTLAAGMVGDPLGVTNDLLHSPTAYAI